MASCCRRYRARRLKALGHDPQLLVIRPAPPATSLDHLKPFKLSTALMAVHKDCYAPIELIQQGGSHRRETARLIDLNLLLKVKQRSSKQLSAIELRAQAKLIASTRQAAASIAASLTKERSIGSEQARSFVFGPK